MVMLEHVSSQPPIKIGQGVQLTTQISQITHSFQSYKRVDNNYEIRGNPGCVAVNNNNNSLFFEMCLLHKLRVMSVQVERLKASKFESLPRRTCWWSKIISTLLARSHSLLVCLAYWRSVLVVKPFCLIFASWKTQANKMARSYHT